MSLHKDASFLHTWTRTEVLTLPLALTDTQNHKTGRLSTAHLVQLSIFESFCSHRGASYILDTDPHLCNKMCLCCFTQVSVWPGRVHVPGDKCLLLHPDAKQSAAKAIREKSFFKLCSESWETRTILLMECVSTSHVCSNRFCRVLFLIISCNYQTCLTRAPLEQK